MKAPTIQILQGDCIEKLRTMPDCSVHCCVTSPPYWGLRDYGVAGQIGLERTPEEYVAKMVEVFGEVKRVLRGDGTLWLNLGDSYASTPTGNRGTKSGLNGANGDTYAATLDRYTEAKTKRPPIPPGLKPKDLVGIPWRVAFALQADGWWLRSEIPWIKRNSMPESTTDRPSSAVEKVFLFAKSERYFFDYTAIRVGYKPESLSRYNSPMMGTAPTGRQPDGDADRRIRDKGIREPNPNGRQRRNSDWWFESWQGLYEEDGNLLGFVINPASFKEAHFATFPPGLVKPCILAGSARGCCPKCGAPWERVVETIPGKSKPCPKTASAHQSRGGCGDPVGTVGKSGSGRINGYSTTLGWQPTCDCGDNYMEIGDGDPPVNFGTQPTIPCTVLDPFGGSGTTGQVALELGRNAILIELNPEYVELIERRTNVTPGLALV